MKNKKRISYKFLARQHDLLMKLEREMLKSKKTSVGNIDKYVCDKCNMSVTTIVKDPGTTPFKMDCTRKGCDGLMTSYFQTTEQNIDKNPPSHEWVRPSLRWLKKNRDRISLLDYVFNGGLILLKIKK